MSEGYTQVAPDSTGDKIRTNEIVIGENTVSMQVTNLADKEGNLLGDADLPVSVNLTDIMMAIRRLLQLIVSPAYVDKTVNQLRAQVTGTVVSSLALTSVTTVTTVTGLTNLNAYAANLPVIDANRLAWANVVRARIT